MKENFCDLYKIVCMDPSNEQLMNRWDCIQEYCKLEEIDILELVKLFYGLATDESFKKQFVDLFICKDMTFQARNEREISLLAGAILIELIENEIEVTKIALAILCIIIFKEEYTIPNIQSIVNDKLNKTTLDLRELDDIHMVKGIPSIGFNELKKSMDTGNLSPDAIKDLSKVISNISHNFEILKNNQNKICKSLSIYKEDSNILSWLFGEWSNDLNMKLNNQVEESKVALILGKELADLVEQSPGPYSAKSFLKKMLDHCKTDNKGITLVEIVDALDEKWKNQILEDYNIINGGENTPVLLAISKSLETNQPVVWKFAFQKSFGIDAEKVMKDSLTWAYQIYLECILVKYLNSEE